MKTAEKGSSSFIERLEKIHPHLMLMYVGVVGSSLIFFFLSLLFVITALRQQVQIALPSAFAFSTAVLLMSSYFAHRYLQHFKNDRAKELAHSAWGVFMTGIVFTISQVIGWIELSESGVRFAGKATGAYLYLLSGLHVLHLLGGLIYTLVQAIAAHKISKDAVQALIVFSNRYEWVKARMLVVYWHFLDVVWIVLFIFFALLV
ncbi:MAG: cytochrome c oxidase subunit 3 [Cytophagales bacterium]|nr:cytochrome c oxidase subunit 3 [Bernardetiaceae bacterium]MDW8203937.1 cytochrome c oxidase subunit 3 [Cytophagales bacterium]